MHRYIKKINTLFSENANAENAKWSKEYLLNQFDFFGIKAAYRRKIAKEWMKENPIISIEELEQIVKECWQLKEREFQYFGVELLAFHKKLWQPNIIKLIEFCLVNKSWWDSVDHICSECLNDYFTAFPEKIIPVTSKWNSSKNIWLQRSSIMFQKKFKQKTDTQLLEKYILNLSSSKEFFVQKAIGWALREYGKTNESWVQQFVVNHQHLLANLSKREALKRIDNKSKQT